MRGGFIAIYVNYVQSGRRPPSWILPEVDFYNSAPSGDALYQRVG